jgi:hypothetical protein
MHGNESTTTKAVVDFMNFLVSSSIQSKTILEATSLYIIPMLNPDGANAYTRVNANKVDLNRDAKSLSQPESLVLRRLYDTISPDFCFNLHDQRTIFNVGSTNKPATVSFLSPAENKERTITPKRSIGMQLIASMNAMLQEIIPGQVGRYDDSFNDNCVGDTFQMLGTPTVLFEAGHYPNDYKREKTRTFIFYSLLQGLQTIADNKVSNYSVEQYIAIPENNKQFFDILIKNSEQSEEVGILYREKLIDGKVEFIPHIDKRGELTNFFGHVVYDMQNPNEKDNILNNKELSCLLKNI